MSEVWEELNSEAENVGREERLLLDYLSECILTHDSFESALSFILANKVSDDVMSADTLRALFLDILKTDTSVVLSNAGEADEVVTIDVRRQIRWPTSLHGKSGLRVTEFPLSRLDPDLSLIHI